MPQPYPSTTTVGQRRHRLSTLSPSRRHRCQQRREWGHQGTFLSAYAEREHYPPGRPSSRGLPAGGRMAAWT